MRRAVVPVEEPGAEVADGSGVVGVGGGVAALGVSGRPHGLSWQHDSASARISSHWIHRMLGLVRLSSTAPSLFVGRPRRTRGIDPRPRIMHHIPSASNAPPAATRIRGVSGVLVLSCSRPARRAWARSRTGAGERSGFAQNRNSLPNPSHTPPPGARGRGSRRGWPTVAWRGLSPILVSGRPSAALREGAGGCPVHARS